jgi:hypothetical protein
MRNPMQNTVQNKNNSFNNFNRFNRNIWFYNQMFYVII